MDSMGILISLILGGLGMFLLVLAVTFLAVKTISTNEFERFTYFEDVLVEPGPFIDEHSRDIFIINDSENPNNFPEPVKNPMLLEMVKETTVMKISNFVLTLSGSWRNLFGKRLINL